ncbi:MAG: hypothetical protein V3R25_06265 [Nitrosomonadaceae bacterium]
MSVWFQELVCPPSEHVFVNIISMELLTTEGGGSKLAACVCGTANTVNGEIIFILAAPD